MGASGLGIDFSPITPGGVDNGAGGTIWGVLESAVIPSASLAVCYAAGGIYLGLLCVFTLSWTYYRYDGKMPFGKVFWNLFQKAEPRPEAQSLLEHDAEANRQPDPGLPLNVGENER